MSNDEGPERWNSNSNNLGNVNYGSNNSNNNSNIEEVRIAKGASNQSYNKNNNNRNKRNLRTIIKSTGIRQNSLINKIVDKLYSLTNVTANKIKAETKIKFKNNDLRDIIKIIGRRKVLPKSEMFNKIRNMTSGKIPLNKQAFLNFYKNDGELMYNKAIFFQMKQGTLPLNKERFMNLHKRTNSKGNAEKMYTMARYNLMKKLKMKPELKVFENLAFDKYSTFPQPTEMELLLMSKNELASRVPNFMKRYTNEYTNLSKKYNALLAASKKPAPTVQTGPYKRPVKRTKPKSPPTPPKANLSLINRSVQILYPSRVRYNNWNYVMPNQKSRNNIDTLSKQLNAILNKTFKSDFRRAKPTLKRQDFIKNVKAFLKAKGVHSFFDKKFIDSLRMLNRQPKQKIPDVLKQDLNNLITRVSKTLYPTSIMLKQRKQLIDKSANTIRVLKLFAEVSKFKTFKSIFSAFPFKQLFRNKNLKEILDDIKHYIRISRYPGESMMTDKQLIDTSSVLNGVFLSKSSKNALQNRMQNMLMLSVEPNPLFFRNKKQFENLKRRYNNIRNAQMASGKMLSMNTNLNKFFTVRKNLNRLPVSLGKKKKFKPTLKVIPEETGTNIFPIVRRTQNKTQIPKPPPNYKPASKYNKREVTFRRLQKNDKLDFLVSKLKGMEFTNVNNAVVPVSNAKASLMANRILKSKNIKDELVKQMNKEKIKYTENNVNVIIREINKPDFGRNFDSYLSSVNLRTTTPRNVISHMTAKGHDEKSVRQTLGKLIQDRRNGKNVPEDKENALKKGFSEDAWKKAQKALSGKINIVRM